MAFDLMTNEVYETETCCSCGVRFAMTRDFRARRLENRGQNNPFYCPNGHKQWYTGKTEAERLREENERLHKVVDREREYRASADRKAAAARGQVTKIKKRASAGTCPCCSRTFSNMAEHMKRQHPEFVREQGAKVIPLKAVPA